MLSASRLRTETLRTFTRSVYSFHPTKPPYARKGGKKRSKANLDLGWDKLTAPLDAAPLALPNLRALKIEHHGPGITGKIAAGSVGARKFKPLIPALRWQNPEAEIMQRYHAEDASEDPARVTLVLDDGERVLDPMGKRSEDILRDVLEAAGAPADTIDTSVEWAIEFLKGRSSTSKPHEMRRNLRQQAMASEEGVLDDDDGFAGEFADEFADGFGGDGAVQR